MKKNKKNENTYQDNKFKSVGFIQQHNAGNRV